MASKAYKGIAEDAHKLNEKLAAEVARKHDEVARITHLFNERGVTIRRQARELAALQEWTRKVKMLFSVVSVVLDEEQEEFLPGQEAPTIQFRPFVPAREPISEGFGQGPADDPGK